MKKFLSIIFILSFSFSAYSYQLTGSGEEAFSFTQNAAECTYSLSYQNISIRSTGRTGSVNVITQNGCSWTAVSNVPWIIVTSGSSGTGNGTVQFTVLPNPDGSRIGTITIAGQTFTVFQASSIDPCEIM